MAGDWRRERGDLEGAELDKKEEPSFDGGCGANAIDNKEDAKAASMEREDNKELRIWLGITPRRIRIDPRKKRADYIRRLERLMRECDRIIADPEGYEELQIKAMAVLVRAIVVCYELVSDAQVEQLEEELEEIKRRIAERLRADQEQP